MNKTRAPYGFAELRSNAKGSLMFQKHLDAVPKHAIIDGTIAQIKSGEKITLEQARALGTQDAYRQLVNVLAREIFRRAAEDCGIST
jgi:hypothetical protein